MKAQTKNNTLDKMRKIRTDINSVLNPTASSRQTKLPGNYFDKKGGFDKWRDGAK